MVAAARESGSLRCPRPSLFPEPCSRRLAAEPAVDETAADEPVVADDDDDEAVAYTRSMKGARKRTKTRCA